MAWTLPVLIAGSVAALIGAPLWLLHRQRRRLVDLAEGRRQQAELEGQAARQELEDLREGLADGLLVVESETLGLASLNQALLDLLGQTRENLLGARLETLLAPEVRARTMKALQALEEGQSFFAAETRLLRADGSLVMADIAARWARINGRARLLVSLREAGARLAAQQELRQDQALYRSLVETTSDGYFIADLPTGRFVQLNPSIRELFGLSPDGGLTLSIWDVLSPEDHPRARQRQAEMQRQGPSRSLAEPMVFATVRPDGCRRVMEVTSSLTTYQGRPAVQGLVRDVTERENLLSQLHHAQKMQAAGTLAGGVAHEFNNLLMALGGYLQLLRERLDGQDDAMVYVDKMDRACQRASGLTRQMLTLSRQRARRRQAVEPNQVVREVHDLLRQTLPPSITLACELAPDLPPVLADPGQIQQVLLNLGLNARDALPKGGLIRFVTRPASDPIPEGSDHPPRVVLEVGDNGTGMSAEVRERIFEPFFTTKGTGHGTGLGLSVVSSLVRGMGGEITVSSRPEQGSTFSVSLPASRQTKYQKDVAAQAPAARPGDCRSRNELVLVVDDDAMTREILRLFLASHGYQVLEAVDGQDALEVLARLRGQDQAPDLMLLDLAMPVLDGVGLLRRLAADQAAFPILVVSGQDQTLPAEIAGQVREVLEKPLDMSYLLDRLRLSLEPKTTATIPRQAG